MPFLDQNRTPRNILLHTIRENWHFISVRVVTREEACDGKLEGREMGGRLVNVMYVVRINGHFSPNSTLKRARSTSPLPSKMKSRHPPVTLKKKKKS